MLDTYFAPAEKVSPQLLQAEIDLINNHPIIDTLLNSVGGLLAVLNEQRQVLALNDSFLAMLGLEDQKEALSLRPGEAVHCIHASEPPHGCGTTKACASCGAAIAMVTCLTENVATERICSLTAKNGEKTVDLSLSVRAQPITIDFKRYILLFLQDITKEQFLLSMERTFFHDTNNIISGLLGKCQLFAHQHGNSPDIEQIINLVIRVSQEIAIQRTLSDFGESGLKPIRQNIKSADILAELSSIFANHPAAQDRVITSVNNAHDLTVTTDMPLLLRVLCNMVTNALEATEEGGEIKVMVDERPNGTMAIQVWNRTIIQEAIKPRIFQRHFSTKSGQGRGLGTYSMKVFGEQYLGGKINFSSTTEDGTIFCLTL